MKTNHCSRILKQPGRTTITAFRYLDIFRVIRLNRNNFKAIYSNYSINSFLSIIYLVTSFPFDLTFCNPCSSSRLFYNVSNLWLLKFGNRNVKVTNFSIIVTKSIEKYSLTSVLIKCHLNGVNYNTLYPIAQSVWDCFSYRCLNFH